MVVFTRFVERGRIAIIRGGPRQGRPVVITDIIDHNKAVINGPCSGVKSRSITIKRLFITEHKIEPAIAENKLKKNWIAAGIDKKWKNTSFARSLRARKIRMSLTDYDRYKLMKAKQAKRNIIKRALRKAKSIIIRQTISKKRKLQKERKRARKIKEGKLKAKEKLPETEKKAEDAELGEKPATEEKKADLKKHPKKNAVKAILKKMRLVKSQKPKKQAKKAKKRTSEKPKLDRPKKRAVIEDKKLLQEKKKDNRKKARARKAQKIKELKAKLVKRRLLWLRKAKREERVSRLKSLLEKPEVEVNMKPSKIRRANVYAAQKAKRKEEKTKRKRKQRPHKIKMLKKKAAFAKLRLKPALAVKMMKILQAAEQKERPKGVLGMRRDKSTYTSRLLVDAFRLYESEKKGKPGEIKKKGRKRRTKEKLVLKRTKKVGKKGKKQDPESSVEKKKQRDPKSSAEKKVKKQRDPKSSAEKKVKKQRDPKSSAEKKEEKQQDPESTVEKKEEDLKSDEKPESTTAEVKE